MTKKRSQKRQQFIENSGIAAQSIITQLPCDASFRHYYRIMKPDGQSIMLMDAPPEKEDIRPFICVAKHLVSMELSAPLILASDEENGFLLIEDFGNDTYTQLLNRGVSEKQLYETAIDVLIKLHNHPKATDIKLPSYDTNALLEEAVILPDWYWPEIKQTSCPHEIRNDYLVAWETVFNELGEPKQSLVLRDYHVDNLMLLQNRKGVRACGLLDFQDALIGPCAYDLASLLEDARRDISSELSQNMLERYFEGTDGLERDTFYEWYRVLGAQRHAKVVGIFTRLFRRDDKPLYLKHIPRVLKLLKNHMRAPGLTPVREWFEKYLPDYTQPIIAVPEDK
ncbi:MAG: phosphotransferase [Desulfobacterales bacterium]|nr:phosphotransferase [Desulfobacterales bacterium]